MNLLAKAFKWIISKLHKKKQPENKFIAVKSTVFIINIHKD